MEVKVVPWYNADEFRRVYECIFSPEMEDKNWAVDTMTIWKTRADPCLPAAIECTYLITSALVQDALFLADRAPIRQHAIELQYSCAIVRFVNLTIAVHEKEYSTMNEKQSKMWMAKQLGIPTYIVDLRDQISHTLITPPLPHLRSAAVAAMDYLKKSYWDIEAPRVRNHVKKLPDTIEYENAIRCYIKTQFQIVRDEKKLVAEHNEENMDEGSDAENTNDDENDVLESVREVFKGGRRKKRKLHNESAEENKYEKKMTDDEKLSKEKEAKEMAEIEKVADQKKRQLLKDLRRYLKVIDKLLVKNKGIFLQVLVKDFFIPLDEEMKYFVDKETFELFTDLNEDPNSTPDASCIPDIPWMHEVLWLPIIQALNTNDAVPLFLEKLLLSQRSRSVIGQKFVLAWVIKILKSSCKEGRDSLIRDEDQGMKNIFFRKAIVATWERLFMSALENPCRYTPVVLPWITKQCTLDKGIVDTCMKLLAIYLGKTHDVKTMPQPERTFSFEDFKRAKRLQEAIIRDDVEECIFKKVTDNRFANLPIGYRIPAEKKQNDQEEDNSESFNEDQDFKVNYIISDSESESIDLDEYYSQFKQSNDSDDELFIEKCVEEAYDRESFVIVINVEA